MAPAAAMEAAVTAAVMSSADMVVNREKLVDAHSGSTTSAAVSATAIGSDGYAPIRDYKKYMSPMALSRVPSPLKALAPYLAMPDILFLAGGLPPSSHFPFDSIALKLKGENPKPEELHVTDPAAMFNAQQYQGSGYKPLQEWCRRHAQMLHSPPNPDWDVALSAGNTDAIDKICNLLLKPGDVVLVEEHSYPQALCTLRTFGARLVSIHTDEEGIVPAALEAACEQLKKEGVRPSVLYTIPVAQNPTGANTSKERYHAIYRIANKYDFIIMEDDPYIYLQWSPHVDGLKGLGMSYLSIDTAGRVLRLDTFSKMFTPGMRLGWISGPKALLRQYTLHAEISSQSGAPFTSVVTASMMETWGTEGFSKFVAKLQQEYKRRRDVLVGALEEHCRGVAEWKAPESGKYMLVKRSWMFVWLTVLGVEDTTQLCQQLVEEERVLLVPGKNFRPDAKASPCIRISFSYSHDETMVEGIKRLGSFLKRTRS
eukprot:jgi/Chlat1/7309/Chrsp58S09141